MNNSFFLTLTLITILTCLEAGTTLGESSIIDSPALPENMSNLYPNPPLPDRPEQNLGSNNQTDINTVSSSGLIEASALLVNLTKQNPDPARPGETVELTVSVQNIGNKDLQDITVTIAPEYPFSQASGETLEKTISYLNARQDNNDAAVFRLKLMTDSNTSEGDYDIDITTSAKESSSSSNTITTTKTFYLEVRGKEYAQVVTINKANIDVGKEEPLEFIITNTGNSPLKNMVVSWKDPKGVVLPVYSDNTRYIKYLEPNQSVKVAYSVMADVSATPGLYTINVNLNFEDYESTNKSIQTTAGLFVGGTTDFDVVYSESSQGKVSFSIANVGNNEAYAVKLSIPEQKYYRVMGSPSTILGNLEKGDYTIAAFNVTSTQSLGNNSPLKVLIEYTNAKGERVAFYTDVTAPTSGFNSMSVSGTEENKSNGLDSSIPYIVLIVIVGTGILLYRRGKRRK
jgi:hypothetical protein